MLEAIGIKLLKSLLPLFIMGFFWVIPDDDRFKDSKTVKFYCYSIVALFGLYLVSIWFPNLVL